MRAFVRIAWLLALASCAGPRAMTVADPPPTVPASHAPEAQPIAVEDDASPSPPCMRGEPVGPGESIALTGEIRFRIDSDQFLPPSIPVLDALAETLARETRFCRVDVTVHAMEPPYPQGQQLGRARAASVVGFLVERGIERTRLHPVGLEDAQRPEDRRLEIVGHEVGCPCAP